MPLPIILLHYARVDHRPLLKILGDSSLEHIPNTRLRNLKEKTLRSGGGGRTARLGGRELTLLCGLINQYTLLQNRDNSGLSVLGTPLYCSLKLGGGGGRLPPCPPPPLWSPPCRYRFKMAQSTSLVSRTRSLTPSQLRQPIGDNNPPRMILYDDVDPVTDTSNTP